jgi:hypothetical protein
MLCHHSRLFQGLDLSPIVCRRALAAVPVMRESQSIVARLAALGVTAAPALRHLNESQSDRFPDSRGNRVAMDPVFDEILVGHRKLAIVVAAVVRQLDFDAGNDPMCRLAELSVRRAFKHFDQPD